MASLGFKSSKSLLMKLLNVRGQRDAFPGGKSLACDLRMEMVMAAASCQKSLKICQNVLLSGSILLHCESPALMPVPHQADVPQQDQELSSS